MAKRNDNTNAPLVFGFTTDPELIGSYIVNIGARGANIKQDIQVTCVCATVHAAQHGDVKLMQRLDEAMGKGFHRNGLRAWAVKYGCFGYRLADAKSGAKAGYTLDSAKAATIKAAFATDAKACETALMSTLWHEVENEPAFNGFDLAKQIKRLVAKAKKAQSDPVKSKHPETKIDPALLAKLDALSERGTASVH